MAVSVCSGNSLKLNLVLQHAAVLLQFCMLMYCIITTVEEDFDYLQAMETMLSPQISPVYSTY